MVRIRGASCVNVSKRFVESDPYNLLWCVNLMLNWRTRCDEWTNDTSTQIRQIFSYTRCANHHAWRIVNTNHASCGPSLRTFCSFFAELFCKKTFSQDFYFRLRFGIFELIIVKISRSLMFDIFVWNLIFNLVSQIIIIVFYWKSIMNGNVTRNFPQK